MNSNYLRKLLLFCFTVLYLNVMAQEEKSKVFLDKDGNECTVENALFLKVTIKNSSDDTAGVVKIYTLDEVMISSTGYSNLSKQVKNGMSVTYYPSGQVNSSISYFKGKINGSVKQFYEDGALKRDETYEYKKKISGQCYTRTGQDSACSPYCIKAVPPENYMNVVKRNFRIPQNIKGNNFSGKVLLSYYIEIDGSITDIKVEDSKFPSLDEELIRIIKLFGHGTPEYIDGQAVRSKVYFPFEFNL